MAAKIVERGDPIEPVYLNNLRVAAQGWGYTSGLAVSQRGAGANMSVDVSIGDAFINAVSVSKGSITNVAITAAHATYDRYDLIVINSSGSISAIDGTAAATSYANDYDLEANNAILLAEVYVPALDTTIEDAQITDKRIISPALNIMDIIDVTAETIPSLRGNVALNAFEISILRTFSIHDMLDGVRDVFNDAAGILSGGYISGGILTFTLGGTAIKSDEHASFPATNAFDANDATDWLGDAGGGLGWIGLDLGAGFSSKINRYTVRSSSTRSITESPRDFTLEGSDTGAWGGEEVVIDTQTSITFSQGETKTYDVTHATAYRYYRLNVTDDNGSDVYVCISALDIRSSEVISVSTAAESQSTNTHVVMLVDDAAITLNTDLKFYASVDDGATWGQITLSDSGDYSSTEKILTGSVVVAGTGTTMKYKIECTDATFEFYAVGLLWD